MRLNTGMSQEEIRSALQREARETWGEERLEALKGPLNQAANALWRVLQEPLAPLGEEPDLPPRPRQTGWEG